MKCSQAVATRLGGENRRPANASLSAHGIDKQQGPPTAAPAVLVPRMLSPVYTFRCRRYRAIHTPIRPVTSSSSEDGSGTGAGLLLVRLSTLPLKPNVKKSSSSLSKTDSTLPALRFNVPADGIAVECNQSESSEKNSDMLPIRSKTAGLGNGIRRHPRNLWLAPSSH